MGTVYQATRDDDQYQKQVAIKVVRRGMDTDLVLARFRKTDVMLIGTLSLFALLLTVFGLNHLGSFSSSFFYLLLGALLIEVLVMSGFTPAALNSVESGTPVHSLQLRRPAVCCGVGAVSPGYSPALLPEHSTK